MVNLKCSVALLACLLPFAANCQESGVKSLRGKPSTEQIIEALNPGAEAAGKPTRTRGLSLGGSGQAVAPVAGWTRTLDLEIKFQFNSDQLTGDGAEVVERLGNALQAKELAKVRTVTLEGHADATGDADYNVALSLRRAQAVRNALAGKPGLPTDFKTIGKGSSDPADPAHPTDPVNRRVRVIVGG
jgi:outer membrane protein OmpA-like peptidoglycan-associated protein